jgi:hypothetical protein
MKEETEQFMPSFTQVIDEAIKKISPTRKHVFNPESTPLRESNNKGHFISPSQILISQTPRNKNRRMEPESDTENEKENSMLKPYSFLVCEEKYPKKPTYRDVQTSTQKMTHDM